MNLMQIIVKELYISGRTVVFPVTPETLKFDSGGTRFATYEILDKGEVVIPNGENLRKVSWEGIFPGENHDLPYKSIYTNVFKTPQEYQSVLSEWEAYGTPLRLIVTGTPVNMYVYLKNYKIDYAGAFGDYSYNVEFTDKKEITVTSTVLPQEEQAEAERAESQYKTYTVVEGDNLHKIARKFSNTACSVVSLYELNKDVIEETAIKHGLPSSNRGWWIYAGTVLKLPTER